MERKGLCMVCMVIVFMLLVLMGIPVFAQGTSANEEVKMEEVVVTATRTQEKPKILPVSISIVTEEEIEASGFTDVSDLLKYVEGIYVQAAGGPGAMTNLRIRGLDSRWVMVMVDGMEMNDPSAVGGAFDFSDLSVDDIQRIEVVRGPESPLYGSDAMAGVVNIITKTGKGKPSFALSGYLGSMDTWQARFESQGRLGLLYYSFAASHLETNGIAEDDRYWRGSYALKIGADVLENLRFEGACRFINTDLQYDDFDFMAYRSKNDPNQYQKVDRLVATFTSAYVPFDWWESQLKVGVSDTRRKYSDKWDPESTDHSVWGDQLESRQSYTGRIKKVDWQNTLYLLSREDVKDTMVVGCEYREDEGKSTSYTETAGPWGITKENDKFPFRRMQFIGYYIQNSMALWDSLYILTGLRVEDPDDFGGRTTYNLGASYHLKATDTVFKARYATGFKAPTLYELYAPPNPAWWFLGGNGGLEPEEGESYELGISQSFFSKRLAMGLTFFHEAVNKKILYYTDPVTWQGTYENVSAVVNQGVEADLEARPLENIVFKAGYTYTDPEDREHHRRIERVPINQWNASLFYSWKDRVTAFLAARFAGDRVDRYGASDPRVRRANAYTVVDGKIAYRVSPHFQIFIRGENILNRRYEEVKGYESPGASWYLGSKVSF